MWQWVQRHVTCKNHANMDQPSMTRKSSEQTNGVTLELLALCVHCPGSYLGSMDRLT